MRESYLSSVNICSLIEITGRAQGAGKPRPQSSQEKFRAEIYYKVV